ncbi:uncharacterized protein [Hoplias malabaricus]|uniref:uncharacterized protein isoform X2 n=1 Tax=Hoplias malabaricus TaxID=27720 RepID=UPI0034631DBF
MADCQSSSDGEDSCRALGKQLDEIIRNCRPIEGYLKRYILHTMTLIDGERLRRERFGEEDKNKPHKTILMVGETGTGKSTLINSFINHMLGVQWENRVWCEIIETRENQTESLTKAVTVYDVFIEEFPFSLTVIDTPGYGNTGGKEEDLNIAEMLHELFRSKDGVDEVDAVCFVVTSNFIRLTESHLYVFDAILSLFGKDMESNIVLFITHATQKPINALQAIKQYKVRCAKTKDGKPVFFSIDNSHCEALHEDDKNEAETKEDHKYRAAWEINKRNMMNFFDFLNDDSKPVSLKMSDDVLRKREQLTAAINNIKDRITLTELRKQELEQTKAALEQHEKIKKDMMNNFEYEVDEPYKEMLPIESKWWNKKATCCTVCEENCHYPGCWCVGRLKWCSVMKKGKCTVCSGKCDHTKHVKEKKMYVSKTRKVKKINGDQKQKYETETGEKRSLMSRLKNQIKDLESEKDSLMEECYKCVVNLLETALNTDSVLCNLDFLIENWKETDRVQNLEELKKKSEAANRGLL